MTKQDKIDELEAALARAKGEAKQWEERCALSWELRETAEKEHEAEIEKLNLSIDNLIVFQHLQIALIVVTIAMWHEASLTFLSAPLCYHNYC